MGMVTTVTSFGRSGLYDWLLQRFTAVILLTYTICVGSFLLLHPQLDYATWAGYMRSTPMKVFSLMALLSIVAHAWIGLWSVSTDYLTVRMIGPRGNMIRILFQAGYAVVLFAYLVWGVQILWGN
jgi:succinate dehydrogenase / fumarate reductase membrane anchor subunit